MIPFLNRNDEKLPHTRQIKIVGRNHILPQLGIEKTFRENQKQREPAARFLLQGICFVKRFYYECSLFSG
jgi:hypothetical protein